MIYVPKVSVIMGVYNCKDVYALYRSVNSIISQTFTDWEYIICDDGSSDNTFELLKTLETLDPRIKIISYKENHGLAYALNTCLNAAQGEYIARMDDDDISRADRFAKQVKFLDAHQEIAFVGSIANVFNDGGIWGVLRMPEYVEKEDFLWNIPFIHPSIIFRREALAAVGGYSTDSINRRCEDYTLVMDLYSKKYRGYNIQETLLDYQVKNDDKKYRPMRDRIAEAKVRYYGYRKNGILVKGIPYIVKPIILGLIPQWFFRKIKQWQYNRGE